MARDYGDAQDKGTLEDWQCPDCGYTNTDHIGSNEIMCTNCGDIMTWDEVLDPPVEWEDWEDEIAGLKGVALTETSEDYWTELDLP